MLLTMLDTSQYDIKIEKLNSELTDISNAVSELIHQNATTEMSQEKFNAEYERLVAEYEKKEKFLSKLQSEKEKQAYRISEIEAFINNLKTSPDILSEWDDMLWIVTVSKATIHHDGKITFEFKDGSKTTI